METHCPECGSEDIELCHVSEDRPPAYTETDYWLCSDCGYEWGYE